MANPNVPAEQNLAAVSTKGEGGVMPETGEHAATTEAAEGHGPVAEPTALGLDATAWVALAMIAVIAIMLWKKVPAAIGKALDKKIAGIREQLDEATRLRTEAEALRAEYEAKTDAAALVERRTRMAEDKIAAAERSAIAEVRAKAVTAATIAAERLIRDQHDATADRAMVDRTIAGLGRTH